MRELLHAFEWSVEGVVVAGLLLVVSAVLVVVEPVHGAVLLVVTPQHGFDAGDLVALPSLAVAVALLARSASPVGASWNQHAGTRRRTRGLVALAWVAIGAALAMLGALDSVWETVHPEQSEALAASVAILGATASTVLWLLHRSDFSARSSRPSLAPVVALLVGFLLDAVATPKGTVLGPTLLAVLLAVRAPASVRRWLWAGVVVLVIVDVGAIWSFADSDVVLAARGAGWTRTLALGSVLILYGATSFVRARTGDGERELLQAA